MNGGYCSCSTLPWSTSVSHRVLCHRRLNKNFLSRRCSARSLSSRGYSLDFKLSDDPNLALKRYGNYLYVGLIIFAPAVDRFEGSFNQAAVLDFVDSGRDLIIVLDVNSSDFIREIATECGVDFDEDPRAMVIDHTSYALSGSEGDHTLVASDNFVESNIILGARKLSKANDSDECLDPRIKWWLPRVTMSFRIREWHLVSSSPVPCPTPILGELQVKVNGNNSD